MLIFCYGSNMCMERIGDRIPGARILHKALLRHHILKFHKAGKDGSGKADVHFTGNKNDHVWGSLIEVDKKEKKKLDTCEGLGKGYEEKEVILTSESGEVKAWTYFALSINPGLKPFEWYKLFVLRGAIQHKLPSYHINRIREVQAVKDHNTLRREKNLKLINKSQF